MVDVEGADAQKAAYASCSHMMQRRVCIHNGCRMHYTLCTIVDSAVNDVLICFLHCHVSDLGQLRPVLCQLESVLAVSANGVVEFHTASTDNICITLDS